MKRTILLLGIIGVLCAAWAGGWFFVAGKVEEIVGITKQRLLSRGQEFDCKDQAIGGFPFRISFDCDAFSFSDLNRNVSVRSGALRSAAQAYQPGKVVLEMDGPAVVDAPQRQKFDVDWKSMRASLNANLEGLEQFSVVARNLDFRPADARFDSATIEQIQLHGRKLSENNANFVIRSRGANSPQNRWPGFDLETSVQFDGIFNQLLARPDLLAIARKQGLSGQLNGLDYTLQEGGKLTLSGPFQLTNTGILSGKFDVNVKELQELIVVGKRLFPEQRQILDQIASGLTLFAGSGNGGLKFPLTVRNGNASVGLLPVGQIPALF